MLRLHGAEACRTLMDKLYQHRYSWPFLDPEFVLETGESARFAGLVALDQRVASGSVASVDELIDDVVQVSAETQTETEHGDGWGR